uniref:AB hydrolase-1 domain-containing protein n=1 Tax=Chelydra serpentina TaxID=8475 RepID=A0A8C3SHU6_CHESE
MPSLLKWSLPVAGIVSELKFPVPWGHIAAKAWGSPQGHPVLCLHGWLDNANTFNRLIPLLPKDYCYMAMDFGGHGLSSHRPAGFPYHFLDYVSEVRRVTAGEQAGRTRRAGSFVFLAAQPERTPLTPPCPSCDQLSSASSWLHRDPSSV